MMFRDEWQQLVVGLPALRIFPGVNCRVDWTPTAQVINAAPGLVWRHPWYTTAEWLADDSEAGGAWVARVNAGFVNGIAPVVTTTVGQAPALTIARETATGTQGVDLSKIDAAIESPLIDAPALRLSWRAIGLDGVNGEKVPAFFKAMGAVDQQDTISADANTGMISTSDAVLPESYRLLRACDIVLVKPRAGLSVSIALLNIVTDAATMSVEVGLQAGDVSAPSRIVARAKGVEATVIYGASAQDYEDRCVDEKLISTVYLLSPPRAALGSEPDQTWTPYSKHSTFWNLNWQQPLGIDPTTYTPFQLFVPLAGGVAQLTVNWLLSNVNDANDAALAEIKAHDMTGSFWTI